MRYCISLLWIGLIVIVGAHGAAAAEMLACPPRISVDEHPAKAPPGWSELKAKKKQYDNPIRWLVEVKFYEASVPDVELQPVKKLTYWADGYKPFPEVFNFDPTKKYGVSCIYFGTSIVMEREVPSTLRQCTVAYFRSRFKSMSCR